ncbi:hypothetical protein H310_15324, partial [Aphanomyces invadans]
MTKVALQLAITRQTVVHVWRTFRNRGSIKSSKAGRVGKKIVQTANEIQDLSRA